MMYAARRAALTFLIMSCVATGAAAQAPADAENCKDHPMFSRMKSFTIGECKQNFDAVEMYVASDTKNVEGDLTEVHYSLTEGAPMPSPLQIRRNYGAAAKSLGGTVLYDEDRHLTARVSKGGKEVWLKVEVFNEGHDYTLWVVQVGAMVQEVTATDMLNALTANGFVALPITFATGKADIEPASMPLVAEVVRLLKENPALKVSIEGHTDNVGVPQANKLLSEQRAKAVMAAVAAGGVAPGRLASAGFGQESPVADNRTEEGRAKNRRVEIVKK